MSDLHISPDKDAVARAAADLFIVRGRAAIAQRGFYYVVLAGGSTPKATYQLLAQPEYAARLDWSKTHLFWGDERCVEPDDVQSNYRMVREALLNHIPITMDNVHRIQGEIQPHEAAEQYEKLLRRIWSNADWPRFDLVLLGMGDDGHTASLFPHTAALHENKRWVAANYVERVGMWRVTLTAPAINHAACVAFMVTGASKAARLKEVLNGVYKPQELPAQLIAPTDGDLLWLLDADAARLAR